MVVFEWFERISGTLAPDPHYDADEAEKDDAGTLAFWEIVAPSPSAEEQSRGNRSSSFLQEQRQQPPMDGTSSASATTPYATPFAVQHDDPHHCLDPPPTPGPGTGKYATANDLPSGMKEEILEACFTMTNMQNCNKKYLEDANNLHAYGSEKKAPNDKVVASIRKILTNNFQEYDSNKEHNIPLYDPLLMDARTRTEKPFGLAFTPLHCAAKAGAVWFIKLLFDVLEERPDDGKRLLRQQLQRTDLSGKTAMHIAAHYHQLAVTDLLREYEQRLELGTQQLLAVDASGYTAFAHAMKSPAPKSKAKKENKKENKKVLISRRHHSASAAAAAGGSHRGTLFSPDDPSVVGSATPCVRRTQCYAAIRTMHGTGHMNGRRIDNEDATYCTTIKYQQQVLMEDDTLVTQTQLLGFFFLGDGTLFFCLPNWLSGCADFETLFILTLSLFLRLSCVLFRTLRQGCRFPQVWTPLAAYPQGTLDGRGRAV